VFQPDRYGAWLVTSMDEGDVVFVDLGDAAEINALIGNALRAIQESAEKLAEQDEELAAGEANDALARLSLRIWQPIEARLGTSTSIILSPDANLWLVPWVALPRGDDSLLIDRCTVSFLNTARDLLREAPNAQPTAPVVLADPDYQLANGGKAAGQVRGAPGHAEPRRPPVGLDKVVFNRLPGTRAEATAVAPHLETYAGSPPQLLLGGDAREQMVRLARNPRVLLLSTHGYFLSDTESIEITTTQHGRGITTGTIRGQVPVNPLLRCGLALAGANTRNQRGNEATDDGILTGLEIVGMDLRGTELVVLSACETGLGDVRNGEGVAGLRQAFQLAGAEAVVATLWQIPDKDTAIIMGDFFANLAGGQSKAEALRNAQLKRIAERRERNGAAHPLFWAAFTLTGMN
jgi:CHAT domain-containing protein